MSILGQTPRYRAYLLRCWADAPGGWRFSMEDPHTGERRGFADLASLMTFIQDTVCVEHPDEMSLAADEPGQLP